MNSSSPNSYQAAATQEAAQHVAPREPRNKANPQLLDAINVDDALLKLSTVSQLAGISVQTIYRRFADDSTFPRPIRLNARCLRVRAGDLRRWLAEQAAV